MPSLREAAAQALEALEIGYDSAKAEADQYHAAMAGYRPQRHAEMDAEVQQIAAAITALRVALAEPLTLTDEVIADLWHQNGGFHHHFARAIERWLKGNP